MAYVLGVDHGLSGALAFLDDQTGVVNLYPMPLCRGRSETDREIDSDEVDALLEGFGPRLVMSEDCWGHAGQGAKSMFNFGKAYGTILTCATLARIPIKRVLPIVWQRAILHATPIPGLSSQANTKARSIAWCRMMFPKVSLRHGQRRTDDHNLADALCLAYYATLVSPPQPPQTACHAA